MAKPTKPISIGKPTLADTKVADALKFAETTPAKPLSGQVPTGDIRLNANVRKDLHLRIKIEAAKQGRTIGEIIEELIDKHIPKLILVFLFVSLVSVGNANALITAEEYLKYPGSKQYDDYLIGIGEGFSWANGILASEEKEVLYCQPRNYFLSLGNIKNILDDEINYKNKQNYYKGNAPIGLYLLYGLQRTFPCK